MILRNAEIFYNGEFVRKDILVHGGKISNISDEIKGENEVNLSGKKVLPGIVDIHTHGCLGYDFGLASKDELEEMVSFYASHGITSILATVMTTTEDNFCNSMEKIKEHMEEKKDNSIIKGINLEGPFLAMNKKGAHDPKLLKTVDIDFFEKLDKLSGGNIKMVDIAPELDKNFEFVEKYKNTKVVSIAHTECNYDQACNAIENGYNHITHMFNAMDSLHHRRPGVIGAFSDTNVIAELICDGIHVDPSVIRLSFKIAPDRIALISDAIAATGLEDGEYKSGGLPIYVKDGKVTLADGTIAGSSITNFDSMQRAIRFGIKPEYAIASATIIPARSVNIDKQVGSIEIGKLADFVVVDNNYNLLDVYKNGKKIV